MNQPDFASPADPTQAYLIGRREVRSLKELYLRSQGEVIVRRYKVFQLFNEDPETSARNHSFTIHVETMSGPTATAVP
jgi:hypothetical protein